jgi:hypothetical protein
MTDQFTYDAASYVLGALSAEEKQAFEAHLAECPACEREVQEFAGLPDLLGRLPEEELAATLGNAPPMPPSLMPRLEFAVRRERRSRRWRGVAAGLVAACLAAVGTAVVIDQTGNPAAPPSSSVPAQALTFRQVGDTDVRATATLVDKAWGTVVEMKCTYEGPAFADGKPRTWALYATDQDGEPHQLGDWTVLRMQQVEVSAPTGLARGQIASLEVRNGAGDILLQAEL